MKQKIQNVKRRIIINSLSRLCLITAAAFGMATASNYGNYQSYWNGTIFAVQSLDFNILAHTLPTKLSYSLLQGEVEELQRTLNSNNGLFGLVITDCQRSEKDCPSQKILYSSNSSRRWKKQLNPKNLPNHPYDLLRDPPPLLAEAQYVDLRNSNPTPTQRTNSGKIIGRVYYIRGVPPTFTQDYGYWMLHPLNLKGSRVIYSLTAALFLTGGFTVWVIIEAVLYAKRKQREQLQQEARELQQQLEEKIQQIPSLITQREQARAELERYQDEQQQRTQELEEAIAVYDTQLATSQQQQEQSLQTLQQLQEELTEAIESQTEVQEQIQEREREIATLRQLHRTQEREKQEKTRILELLRQDLQDTQRRESQTRRQTDKLNKMIAELTRDRDLAQQQSRALEEQLTEIPDINQLAAALEAARTESDLVKEQARDFEIYVIEENERLQTQNQLLSNEIRAAKSKIWHLENIVETYHIQSADENQESEGCDGDTRLNLAWSKLPSISGREAIRALERLGFIKDRQSGSHVILKKTITREVVCVVPFHPDLALGTLKSVLEQAQVTADELIENL